MPNPHHTPAPRWLKPMNKIFLLLQRFGGMKELPVLVVAGRRTGRPRRTPLTVIDLNGERYLLEGFPGADWASNVRAADGVAQLSDGDEVRDVRLVELSAEQAVPVLRAWPELAGTDGPKMMKNAGVVDDVTPDAFAAVAGRCAVFRIDPR
ncbi:deazaflavin-dependent nitroreductase [Gordonia terrae]|uniref:Deazaflavin-dependent nitroreductase n=1 Tax=Gordonia terrae TaxID=2055 RepID=A0A2I1R9V8_9ACTN|nr:nitroreductase/quinone reductase family protein [Gordonia terrae]PKZ65865.1 deazaflavin-dependent nitroreductase [Gordonia terrae]UPW08984.1 nitroreductase/quinone reductase family protein [Gordonia terrae]